MGMTFFSVGDKIMVPAEITQIYIKSNGIEYTAKLDKEITSYSANIISFFESDREQILLKHEKETSDGQN